VELLQRFAGNLADFAGLYHGLTQQKRQQVSDPGAYSPKTPPAIIVASGVRAGATLLVTAGMWYWLAWPATVNAILMATIFCALASSSPRPTVLVQQVLIGFLIAMPLAFITEFLLVAKADNFSRWCWPRCRCSPGAYLISGPRWGGVGVGLGMFSATLVVPANLMRYDVEAFISSELSLTMGVVVAYLMFKVVLPEHTMGHRGHVAAALWREAQDACSASLHRLKRRFDNRVRDLLSQLNAAAGPAPTPNPRRGAAGPDLAGTGPRRDRTAPTDRRLARRRRARQPANRAAQAGGLPARAGTQQRRGRAASHPRRRHRRARRPARCPSRSARACAGADRSAFHLHVLQDQFHRRIPCPVRSIFGVLLPGALPVFLLSALLQLVLDAALSYAARRRSWHRRWCGCACSSASSAPCWSRCTNNLTFSENHL
jgi:hypothetical protein